MQLTATAIQLVAPEDNVIFSAPSCSPRNGNIMYQNGSGIVMVRGATNQCYAKYRIYFGGNVAIPTDGTVGQIAFAVTLNGAPLYNAVGMAYPAAVEQYHNIAMDTEISVPCGCCFSVAVMNIGEIDANIQNANLIVERIG